MDQGQKKATDAHKYFGKLFHFVKSDPYLPWEKTRQMNDFFGGSPFKIYSHSQHQLEMALGRFLEWFAFDYVSQHYGQTPLDVLLTQNFDELSQKELDIFIGWRKNVYGFFEITEVKRGKHFLAREIRTDREYKVLEYTATLQMEEGDILWGKLFPYQGNYTLSGVASRWKKELSYPMKREIARIKERGGKIDFTPKVVERNLFHKKEEEVEGKEREMIEKRLRRKLHCYLGKRFKLKDLQRLMEKAEGPDEILKEFSSQIRFKTNREADEFTHLIIDYWNYFPQEKFAGLSPKEQIREGNKVPLEEALIQDMLQYLQEKVNPDDYPNVEETYKDLKKWQRSWLNKPQKELNGKTPWEAISEERKKLGNPERDFSYLVTITPLMVEGKFGDLSRIKKVETTILSDFEAFLDYIQKHRIKLTPKRKHIPFKEVKSIEKGFDFQDSFTFLGQEEMRGKEERKNYIWFIDQLARGGGFVAIDERGYISLQRDKFEQYRSREIGGKLFQVFRIWWDRTDWRIFQGEPLESFAKRLQELRKSILAIFSELPVGKKTPMEDLSSRFQKPSAKETNGFLNLTLPLFIEAILVRYLKWLGIVETEEKVLKPKMPDLRMAVGLQLTLTGKIILQRMVSEYQRKSPGSKA